MLEETLHIALFQAGLVWDNPKANRDLMGQWFQKVDRTAHVAFLPEMFNTGFSMTVAELAGPMDGETVQWMKRRCAEHQFALCGSLPWATKKAILSQALSV